ncbi:MULTISPECIES: ABC transporter ATP-binding protein/permease [Mycobacterium avium complex (MAC)]|uniref:ABC transporter ATP-binding protein/permease n=1 Tax=Mycobacterium avium complex (MAC) TaxID=120793 RepID=UPI0002529A3D|nr:MULTISPECIES: ABC transporter ATP-binding protein/permease [Mycobacterium avium complex (MAC)]AFC49091.1 SbmA protein [Mycobacterium intracellulare MOTT-02]ASQ86626.1 multidrug ABC transporter ATP-binding protein [Mycobacterium intracellulare subsp. chimaera]MCA2250130.1 ABC transporter ATP-binding protein/permease [Mycobacterium intracellulare]MCA2274437.1 ABC transporter ATP-binding protein/permease [Mycobacterium intracellulare]MCA2325280.1 ABC transporter ATP-binding protein/permease [M
MDSKLFKPSIDWSSAFQDSLQWLAIAWVIGAVCLLAALVAARYLTPWGRQFWRITRGYFVGPTSVKAWLGLGVLLLLVLFSVRLNVLFSYQSNDMYTALQVALKGLATGNEEVKHSGIHNFWVSLGIFILLAAIFIARVILDIYLTQRFIIAWRMWLTGHLTDDWLAGRAYYRDLFIDKTIDNPDQRIQQDIDIFTAGVGGTPNIPSNGTTSTLLFGAVNAVASVISFAAILWNLSGDFNLFGVNVPRAMFWTVLVYVLIVTVVAIWLGRPLIWLSFNNEKLNAAFRYALVRLRDAAEAVGFYRGERVERTQLWRRFTPIIDNYRRYVRRTIIFNGWNWSATQTIIPLPLAIQAPRLFTGEIAFGDVTQTAQAFGNINDSLSFFRNNYDAFAAFRAAIIRLHGLVDANDKGRALPTILVKPSEETAVELRGIEVRTPEGDQLVDSLDIQLDLGDSLVITGRSGAGKTTLLRSLAELWPYASGTLCRPDGDNETMFLSQLPYVPLGTLRTVVCYPNSPDGVADDQLRDVLTKVVLAPLISRLDEEQDWAKVLSPGEQQRVAFARVLLTRPKAVFLDEATSALDSGLEYALYQLVRAELPECVLVSVSHRPAVEQHHEQQLQLLGGGAWQLGPVEKEPAQV